MLAPYQSRKDDRGALTGIMNTGKWEEFNFFESKGEAVRGNHYHKDSIELFYILEGEIKVKFQDIDPQGTPVGEVDTLEVTKGDIFMIHPYTFHTFYCETDCSWINFLSKAFDPSRPDLHYAKVTF